MGNISLGMTEEVPTDAGLPAGSRLQLTVQDNTAAVSAKEALSCGACSSLPGCWCSCKYTD